MRINNRDRIGKAFDYLSEGLYDVVNDVMARFYGGDDWPERWAYSEAQKHGNAPRRMEKHDVQVQLRAITEYGREFNGVLSRPQQSYASELRETRNNWAHSEPFSVDDTMRALDTIERLLQAVDAPDSAADVRKLRLDLQRNTYEEQTRKDAKKVTQISLEPGAGLRPWREIIRPHDDVARGNFNASEFAADLHQVHTGENTSAEYADPREFFARTYLTEGLSDLLTRALKRLGGDSNASPVVNLQTNFGGGKTHSMLALYHLFSGTPVHTLPQEVQELVAEAGIPDLASLGVRRVALVGTYMKPGSPSVKDDGTEVNTLWGELAWQLGGREAYERIAADDRAGTNPGEALQGLIRDYSPALILIDEWVAYARQLVTDKELPAGSFDTQFTFAQSLTEAVRSTPGTMLVISIPASDASEKGADIEIGGANGQQALNRLQNVIRRVADQWRPSSRDESFEIVRRRLFQTPDADGYKAIAAVARSFVTMYRSEPTRFPRDAASPNNEYEARIKASYPLHPELLDRLYEDWSTLERFQRTRGVLKLVSAIVHELWASNDSSPLILPGTVPLDTTTVNTDLTQYLEDQWKPILDSDICGSSSTAQKIDVDRPALGQRFVTQRIARTIFMGAAPRNRSARKGLDKQYVWLGTAVPGDVLGNFSSAIEQLSQRSTYFYEEQGHYWFDTQPSVTKTASDYAERLREDPETVWNEIVDRLNKEFRHRGDFARVHVAPASNADIPDDEEARLVIMHPRHSTRKNEGADSATLQWARTAIQMKGSSQRTHRNALVFLAAGRDELESAESTTRSYLAWKKVQANSEALNLTVQQRKQADDWVQRLDQTVSEKVRDAFVWILYPEQGDPTSEFTMAKTRSSQSDGQALAQRVSEKLNREELLVKHLGALTLGALLHKELGKLWAANAEITVGELWRYFTTFIYMPRLTRRSVLDEAIQETLTAVLGPGEEFALATGKNEEDGKYKGLVVPPAALDTVIHVTDSTLLVGFDCAQEQRRKEEEAKPIVIDPVVLDRSNGKDGGQAPVVPGLGDSVNPNLPTLQEPEDKVRRRFYGSVTVSSEFYSRDISNILKEVVDRLAGAGATLEITLDIQAEKSEGFSDAEMRTVTENAHTLKFDPDMGFVEH